MKPIIYPHTSCVYGQAFIRISITHDLVSGANLFFIRTWYAKFGGPPYHIRLDWERQMHAYSLPFSGYATKFQLYQSPIIQRHPTWALFSFKFKRLTVHVHSINEIHRKFTKDRIWEFWIVLFMSISNADGNCLKGGISYFNWNNSFVSFEEVLKAARPTNPKTISN